jgi:transmembrane sensor
MNSPLPHHNPADEEAAALWAARLESGPLSTPDLRAFETWLEADTCRRQLVADYCEFASDVGRLLPILAAEGRLPSATVNSSPRPRPRRLGLLAFGGLAAVAAAVALFFTIGRNAPAKLAQQEFATAAAQRHSFTLADGTRIDLSARTQVAVTLGKTARHVQLANGLAFFAVAKDPGKPFTVDTPAGSVLVTGTQFAVRAEPGADLEVIVTEGHVQVTPAAAAPVSLGAGQHLTTRGDTVDVVALTPAGLADALAWREGRIVFAATSVAEALADFSRYHGRAIEVTPEAAQLRVGGRYSLDDLDGFLAALEEILPIQITRSSNGPVQVGLRAGK